jgi:hypothetical protein
VSGRWLRGTGATLRFLSLGTGRPDAVRRDSVRRTLAKLIGGARHDSQQPAPSTERIKDFQTQELLPSPDLPRRLKFDCGRNDIQRLPGNAVPSPVCCSAGAPLILAPRIRNSRELARAGCRFSRARLPAVTEGDPAVHRISPGGRLCAERRHTWPPPLSKSDAIVEICSAQSRTDHGTQAVHRVAERDLASGRGRAHSNSTTSPSRMVTRRSMRLASSALWVATMAARPEACTSWPSVANTCSAV